MSIARHCRPSVDFDWTEIVLVFNCRSAGDTLTLEIYRKNGNKPSAGCGVVTSDQLNAAELHSGGILQHQPQRQSSPVNQAHGSISSTSSAAAAAAAVGRGAQPLAGAGAISRRVAESGPTASAGNAVNNNGGSGHVWYPSIIATSLPIAPLGAAVASANAPLKVAFNKSIGGGVLV